MRAFVVVVVAVATLIGLGWYFAHTQAGNGQPSVQQQTAAAAAGSAQGANEAGLGRADMRPEKDGKQFQASGVNDAKAADASAAHNSSITFEGAELPNGSMAGRNHQASGSHKNGEWIDPKFEMPGDENEVIGRYMPRKMVHPKDPSIARNAPMNDELLIMEDASENRLSATR